MPRTLAYRNPRGVALATALILMPICMLLMYVFLDKIMVSSRRSLQEQGTSQTFQMAEAGLVLAYDAFQANNFAGLTHTLVNGTLQANYGADNLTVPAGKMSFDRDGDGWLAWHWNLGDPLDLGFANGQQAETIRFRTYYPAAGQWRIDCEARVGTWKTTHTLQGTLENNADYTIFSNGDMEDLTKADSVYLTGKLHANGNIYLLPRFMKNWTPPVTAYGHLLIFSGEIDDVVWPILVAADPLLPAKTALHNPPAILCQIQSPAVEAAGKIIRHTSAHGDGYTNSGDTITSTGRVTVANVTGPAVEMVGGAAGAAFDSDNPNWKAQALSKFGRVVRDGQLGAHVRETFDPRALGPNSFYYRQAAAGGRVLDASTLAYNYPWLGNARVPFFNNAENRLVKVLDVDVEKLGQSAEWPANGLLYSDLPIRLYNARKLKGPLTVVSRATIYTKGSFNLDFPDPGSSVSSKQPAALVTTDRIYHLSSGWLDNPNPAPPIQKTVSDQDNPALPPSQFPPHASQPDGPSYLAAGIPDPNRDKLVINADLVDGVPVLNELNWVPDHAGQHNTFYDANVYFPSNVYSSPDVRNYRGFRWQAGVNCAAGTDCLLEEFHQLQIIMDEPSSWQPGVPYPDIPDADFTPVTIVRTGSVMHLQCAQMGAFSDVPPDWDTAANVTPWTVKSYYTPWVRIYNSEPMFQPGPQQRLPVFAPNISTKTMWGVSQ